jgi:hypothetical protein
MLVYCILATAPPLCMTIAVVVTDHLKLFEVLPEVGTASCFLSIRGNKNGLLKCMQDAFFLNSKGNAGAKFK